MTDEKIRVLFICVHNSARGQMAEAFLKDLGGERFETQSAGLEPGSLNPVVVEVMREIGCDISGNLTKSVLDLQRQGEVFDYVITICDDAAKEKCPVFPGRGRRLHWPFPDPAGLEGDREQKLAQTREIRDRIKAKIQTFIKDIAI